MLLLMPGERATIGAKLLTFCFFDVGIASPHSGRILLKPFQNLSSRSSLNKISGSGIAYGAREKAWMLQTEADFVQISHSRQRF